METKNARPSLTPIFNLLKFTFVIVPIVAGADKFANILTHWEQYLNPSIAGFLPFSAATFMMIVGVVEIIAGLIVLKNPEIGGYIVASWLTLIALTLLLGFDSNFRTWLIRIMMNNCFRKRERHGFKNEISQDVNEDARPLFADADNNVEKIVHNRELGHVIEDALSRIPYDYRMVFSLREINGLNVSETAALMKISASNVKVRLNRSRAMLRREIEKKYDARELFGFNLIYCDAMVENVIKEIMAIDVK